MTFHVIDSSGWLEHFAAGPTAGPNAGFFADTIEDPTTHLLVPAICIYEVLKVELKHPGQPDADRLIEELQRLDIIPLTAYIARQAAQLSHKTKLPMADSIILATARRFQATLWTQDADFKAFEDVRYVEHNSQRKAA